MSVTGYTAVIRQDGPWWIGWIEEISGVNCQGETREELIANLREALSEAIELNREDAKSAAGESFEEIAEFGQAEEKWFRQFLELPNGVPSHDTLERVLSMLDAEEFERHFSRWAQSVRTLFPGEVIAIDGKTIRRSYDRASGKKPVHIVSAWAAENELAIAQIKTDDKSNEITAIPQILESLYLSGCIVTIDAMGCQREIAHQITEEKGADYILSLKGNQPTLQTEVESYFKFALSNEASQHIRFAETVDKGHGRIETRKCWVSTDVDWFEDKEKWAHLNSFVRVESTREIDGDTSVEQRFYISSLAGVSAEQMLQAIRNHWGVENKLHYRLDVSMGEDGSRRRRGNLAQISAAMRKIALNLFRLPGRNSRSIPRLKAKCLYSQAFRAGVLLAGKTQQSRSLMNA